MRPGNDPAHDMLVCLSGGYPFVSGIILYESFENPDVAKSGNVPLPKKNERVLGGHAILVVGYDAGKQQFICRNSWGTTWGDKGYFYLPFAYLESAGLASDLWLIRTVEV